MAGGRRIVLANRFSKNFVEIAVILDEFSKDNLHRADCSNRYRYRKLADDGLKKGHSTSERDEHSPFSRLELLKLEFGSVLIFQVAARPRECLPKFSQRFDCILA